MFTQASTNNARRCLTVVDTVATTFIIGLVSIGQAYKDIEKASFQKINRLFMRRTQILNHFNIYRSNYIPKHGSDNTFHYFILKSFCVCWSERMSISALCVPLEQSTCFPNLYIIWCSFDVMLVLNNSLAKRTVSLSAM